MSDLPRPSLPFEPKSKSKSKRSKYEDQAISSAGGPRSPKASSRLASTESTRIPEVVSRRMLRRMLVFSGIPTFLGIVIFFASYLPIIRGVELPKYAVLLSTLGCFGLGVMGLSYGALSASWDDSRSGGWFGVEEFRTNFRRLTSAWTNNQESSS